MPSFVERPGTTGLNLETERHASAGANFPVNPVWRVETGIRARNLDSPLPDAPQFNLREHAGRAALDYVGAQSLVLGVYVEYIAGAYRGTPLARDFTQQDYGFSASYGVSGLYGLGVELGYTERQDEKSGLNGVSGPTGRIAYRRAISGKSTAGITLFREISSDVLEGGFVDNLGVQAGFATQVTGKSDVALGYEYRRSTFQNVLEPGTGFERKDQMHTLLARWTWQAQPSVLVRTHLGWQVRDSNEPVFRFHGAVIGVAVVFARRRDNEDESARLVGVQKDLIDGVLPAGAIPR